MRAEPELLRGPVAADVLLIRALDGWVAKGGAEGLFCAASNDGLGVALKVVDGAFCAIAPALEHLLAMLCIAASGVHDPVLRNSRGDPIGALRAVPSEHPGHGRK
jgi:L-asparaginase II